MIIAQIYTLVSFSILGVLSFFIAKESPKGEYKFFGYSSLPGIRTPRVLRSRENWVIAHEAMSPYFTWLAIYFSAAAVITSIALYSAPSYAETIFLVSLFVGIFLFALLTFLGDRVVAKRDR